MTTRNFTDLFVRNAKPKEQVYEIADAGQRGLKLAVHPSGQRSFVVRYRHPISGISRKLTLPPGLSLAAARKLSADAMFQVAQGIDPIHQKREQKQAAAIATDGTLRAVGERYLNSTDDRNGCPKRSHDLYRRVLGRVFSYLGERQVTQLKRSEVMDMLDVIARKSKGKDKAKRDRELGGARTADLTLAVLRSMLRWYQKRHDSFVSPLIPGMARLKPAEHARTRLLVDDEIRRVWQASGDDRIGVYGQTLRLMLLCGARRSEAAGIRRSEIVTDDATGITVWKLPARRSKNKQEITRPLSRAALQIIDAQPVISDSDFVFTLDGVRAMNMNYPGKKGPAR
jgi:integrase